MSMKLFILVIILPQFVSISTIAPTAEHSLPLIIPLIHEDSHHYITHVAKESNIIIGNIMSPITIDENNKAFLARIDVGRGFGQKSVEQHVVVDTGSSLLWFNCKPCVNIVPQPAYDPRESITYTMQNFNSKFCMPMATLQLYYGEMGECGYYQRYADNSINMGHIATEDLFFGGSNNQLLLDIAFGCARETNVKYNGVLGLGEHPLSLVSQRHATRFSYCIGNLSDRYYEHNILIIGNMIKLFDRKTPLIIDGKYYINLQDIFFDGESLDIDSKILKRRASEGGIIVDSGSTLSYLPRTILDQFMGKIRDYIGDSLRRDWNIVLKVGEKLFNRLCYYGVAYNELESFPIVEFIFDGELIVEFKVGNLFKQYNSKTFCLSIVPSEMIGVSGGLLGNWMMQYHLMTFDIYDWYLYILDYECEDVLSTTIL